jgi:serine/threonine protein kinase/Tfp pilus assembly protein PilF
MVTTASFAVCEDFLEAFEVARAAGTATDLAAFLPAPGHPQRRAVLPELIRIDLEFGWTEGRPVPLDDYLRRFPELQEDAAARAAVAYEEFRLRRQAGQTPTPEEYALRYGIDTEGWPREARETAGDRSLTPTRSVEQAARLYQTYKLRPRPPVANDVGAQFFAELHERDAYAAERLAESLTSFPSAGEKFLDFRLLRELGRGAFGRVFLAEQDGLAGRRVALKIATDLFGESQTLAQLQHTHIVPIYSVHQAGMQQAVCMPYLGETTLADLLADLSSRPAPPRTGLGLWSAGGGRGEEHAPPPTLVVASAASSGSFAPSSDPKIRAASRTALAPALRRRLEGYSYPEAVLWLGECLADGLAHAHERGILHRDLKPANVLLTDDGQPMLLDFNLAEDTKLRGSASGALVGGTLMYMAPEHLETFQEHAAKQIDERSDVYALGVMLFQLLTRHYPFASGSTSGRQGDKKTTSSLGELIEEMKAERRRPPPRLRVDNPAVSPAAEAIIRKCLEPEPERRYPSARALQEDLRRQLDGLPLKHACEPSWRERWGKWWRRHPRFLGRAAAVSVAALTLAAGILWWSAQAKAERTARALEELARSERAWSALNDFREDVRAAQNLLTAQADDPVERGKGVARGHRALARYPAAADAAWQTHSDVASLPADERARLRREIGELLLLLARTENLADRDRSPDPSDARRRLEKTLELNRLAEACFDAEAPAALWWQRADLVRQLGDAAEGDRLRSRAEETPPQTADDFYLSAVELAGQDQAAKAVELLRQATRLDPRHYRAWFLLGKRLSDQGAEVQAGTCYSVCIALQPQSAPAHFGRGVVNMQLKDYPQARADFDQALALQPEFVEAYVNRALVRQSQADHAGAVEDFSAALDMGGAPTRVYFLRAWARDQAGDAAGAEADRAEGLRREPADERSWIARGLAWLRLQPEQALADFEQALALNPRSRAALRNKAHVCAGHLRRPEDAVAALDLVIKHYPDFATGRAERGVMHARLGRRSAALEDAREALARDGSPALRYQVACIYALTARTNAEDRAPALALLREALRRGYGGTLLAADGDLDPLRTLPEFKRLSEAAAVLNASNPQ